MERRSGAVHGSDAGFEGAQWSSAWERHRLRGGAVERRGNLNPRQGMAAVRSPVFRHAGAWRHAGNEIPQQNRTPEVVRSRATTSPGMLGCRLEHPGGVPLFITNRHLRICAGIADISRNACRRYAPCSHHTHPSQPFLSQLLKFLKNNCEKIWWIRQKAITLHSQSNARCHSSVGRAKD